MFARGYLPHGFFCGLLESWAGVQKSCTRQGLPMKLTKKDGAPSYVSWLTETPKN